MQITRVQIENFKGLKKLGPLALTRAWDGAPRPLTLLLGENGSGKTSLLQAIALTISLATRKIAEPAAFRWPGFLVERLGSHGRTRVEIDVVFEADELKTTGVLFDLWQPRVRSDESSRTPRPGSSPRVTLIYEDGVLSSPEGPEAMSQFLGRFFLRSLLRTDPSLRRSFASVGDAFWFDQNRSLSTMNSGGERGLEGLREYLIGWWGYHTSPVRVESQDYLQRLERLFQPLFPGTRFVGTAPRPGLTASSTADTYVLLERDGVVYDMAEMSSGEQAVFPLLYEFVRLDIARSIVLIDEIELHLHPPQQQLLMSSLLSNIGPGCQFIVTSHSPYLESMTPDEQEIRLEGGRLCL